MMEFSMDKLLFHAVTHTGSWSNVFNAGVVRDEDIIQQ